MFKKALTTLAAVLVAITGIMPVFAQYDVHGTRYTDAFAYLSQKGSVRGYSDGTGRPYALINRAEALRVILDTQSRYKSRVEWYRQHMSSIPLFVDYRQSEWFAPYVESAFEADIVTGYPDRTFRAASPVTTEEAVAMVLKAYGQIPSGQFSHWYEGYTKLAVQKNIIHGGEKLSIARPLTRGQFFDILYRLDTVQTQNLTAFVDPTLPSRAQPQPVITQPVYQPPVINPPPVNGNTGNGDVAQFASQKPFAITIPRLGITDLTITHPKDALTSKGQLSVLKDGVGHLFSYPGRGGKIMVYGHSSSYSWDVSKYTKIFRAVNQLKSGDRVYVTFNNTLYVYQVSGQQTIKSNDVSPFRGRGEELILFTCWPVGTANSRLIVRALPVTTVALR